MSARLTRTASLFLTILMGVVTCWQGVLAFPSGLAASSAPCARKCCCCGHAKCRAPGCCSEPADNRVPLAPASSPTPSPNPWQALAASSVFAPALFSPFAPGARVTTSPSASVTAVPIFQRDCCYLI